MKSNVSGNKILDATQNKVWISTLHSKIKHFNEMLEKAFVKTIKKATKAKPKVLECESVDVTDLRSNRTKTMISDLEIVVL